MADITQKIRGCVPLLQQLARRSPHREICGLIDSSGVVHPVRNVSRNPHTFCMERREYLRALTEIRLKQRRVVCVYHSHVGADPTPSPEDRQSLAACRLPGLIVTTTSNRFAWVPYAEKPAKSLPR